MDHQADSKDLGVACAAQAPMYEPPALTDHGSVVELTMKNVGLADGQTFLGLDIGS